MDDYTYDIDRLKRTALERGWTRYRVAKEAGVSSATVNKLFRGERVTATTVRKIAEALGLELATLVKRNDMAESAR